MERVREERGRESMSGLNNKDGPGQLKRHVGQVTMTTRLPARASEGLKATAKKQTHFRSIKLSLCCPLPLPTSDNTW